MMLITQHLLIVCVLPLQDENCTMFLIAGYSRYNRPYVWVSNTGLAILFITLYQLGSAVMNHIIHCEYEMVLVENQCRQWSRCAWIRTKPYTAPEKSMSVGGAMMSYQFTSWNAQLRAPGLCVFMYISE